MKYTTIAAILLLAMTTFSQSSITVVSPNGGENLVAGKESTIHLNKSDESSDAYLEYTYDDGANWILLGHTTSTTFKWIVPVRKQPISRAFIRATLMGDNGLTDIRDISDSAFTVQATPVDIYEPNNDFSTAYPIAVGDSVVKNAFVVMDWDAKVNDSVYRSINVQKAFDVSSYCTDTARLDVDVYKVSLTAGKLATISVFSCMPIITGGNGIGQNTPFVALFDGSGTMLENAGFSYGNFTGANVSFDITKSGVYYCKIFPEYKRSWSVYGLSINSATTLNTHTFTVDTATVYKDGETYKIQLTSDTASLQLNLTLNKKIAGSITTTLISPDELPSAANTVVKVKAISVGTSDTAFSSSITAADIVIPYAKSNLNGYSEKSLAVFTLNERTNEWTPVASTIDTVNHTITAHATHFSIYGVFVSATTAVRSVTVNQSSIFRMKVGFVPEKQSIAVRFSLPKATTATIRMYDLQGKCLRESTDLFAGKGNSTLLWNVGTLANGRYFLAVKAGTLYMRESILIVN